MVPHEPANDLDSALQRMTFALEPGVFALVGFPEPPDASDFELLGSPPAQIVREAGETTLLVRAECLDELCARHPGARVERELAWVRFEAPMGWEVVGFLARVSGALAEARIPIGAVCGMSRDHLFIARRHWPKTRQVLSSLFPEHKS
jgi:hypothetical protein